MPKECGECSLCCKFLEIPSLQKGADTWCPHCKLGVYHACSIYKDRPDDCVNFNCFWKAESWSNWLRPDRCKVLFEALPGVVTILISVEPSQSDVWKKKKIVEVIEKLRKKGRPLVLKTKNDSEMFIPKGFTRDDVLRDIKTVLDWKEKSNGSANIHN